MSDTRWYYLQDGKRFGPYTDSEMIEIFQRADAPGMDTLVRNDELDQWVPVSKIEGLTPGAKNLFKLKTAPEWVEPDQPPPPKDLQAMIPCPRCKELHPPQARICIRCRKDLTSDVNIPWDTIGLNVVRVLVSIFLILLIMYWFELGPFASSEPETNRAKPADSPKNPASQPDGLGNGLSKPSQSTGILPSTEL